MQCTVAYGNIPSLPYALLAIHLASDALLSALATASGLYVKLVSSTLMGYIFSGIIHKFLKAPC